MEKRGVFFSTDALIALIIILTTLLLVYPVLKETPKKSLVHSDLMSILSTLKMGEIENDYCKSLIIQKKIANTNNSILEQIGEFYARGDIEAKHLAQAILDGLAIDENLGIWYEGELLASKNSTPIETAQNVDVERQMISGIGKGNVTKGFVAKAWLRKIESKKTSLFVKGDNMCGGWMQYSWGYYCNSVPNNISTYVDVPENAVIENAEWLAEPSWVNQNARLYVNGFQIFDGSLGYYKVFNITSYLHPGKNVLFFYSTTGGDDGASHIVVDYSTPEMQTFNKQEVFPLNPISSTAVLHSEKSLFVPSEIEIINVSINTSRNVDLSIRKGAKIVLVGSKTPIGNQVIFSDSEIKAALAAQSISYFDLKNEYLFFVFDVGKSVVGQIASIENNSYIYIKSSEIASPYGSIDITQEIPVYSYSGLLEQTFYKNITWKFFLPVNAIPIVADWQFGWLHTSGTPSQKAKANSAVLYNNPPNPYIDAFSRFGYTSSRAPDVFKEGENNFSLEFGEGYGVSTAASYGYLTYFVKNFVNYGQAMEKAVGGTRTVEFEDGSVRQLSIGNPEDLWDPSKDAIDDSVERLLAQLDSNNNGKIDLLLNEESFDIDTLNIAGVPYIWSTEAQVREWN